MKTTTGHTHIHTHTHTQRAVGSAWKLFQYCQSKIPAIFQRIFHILRGISRCMYNYSTIYRGTPQDTLVEKSDIMVIEHKCE